MNCPHCKNPMIVLELADVETDFCPECEGIWLDAGELELLIEDSSAKDELLNSFKTDRQIKEKAIRCPICRTKMGKVYVGKEQKIIIDECKHGHGLWFDKGEILEVIEMGSINKENEIIKLLTEMYSHKISPNKKEER